MATKKQKLLKAIGHELRFEMLSILNQRAVSPLDLQRELGEDLRSVSYHLNVLRECGCVELVGAQAGDESIERLYRATELSWLSSEQMGELPVHRRERISESWIGHAFGAISRAHQEGTLDARNDRHLSTTPLALDKRGWEEMIEATGDLLNRVLEIRESSARRLEDQGEAGISAIVTIMGYEAPEGHLFAGARARSERGA